MTTRASGDSLAPWLGIAVVLLFALHDRFELVENRALILLALVVGAIGIVRRWRDARTEEGRSPEARALRRRTLIAGAAFAALSVVMAVLRAVIDSQTELRGEIVAALVPPLLGWSIFLVLPIGLAPVAGEQAWTPRLPSAVVVAAITFVATSIAAVARTHFDAIDEVLYTLQAHRFALGHATWTMDPELQRFVKLPLMVATPQGIYSQYPPGYPAILAPFARLGILPLSGAVLAALCVLGIDRLGRRAGSATVGLVAALLLATNTIVLRWSSMYMSHVAAMTALCFAAWLALDAAERADRRGDVGSVLAGFLIGVAVTTRPVTGLAIGLSIWLALAAQRLPWTRLGRLTVMLCVGGVPPAIALLAYNAATNGNPFRLGYHAALGHLNDLGFGTRGIILYDRDVRPVVSAFHFGIDSAMRNEIRDALWPIARDLFPVWSLLPLIAIAVAYRMRVRFAVVAAFAVLPIVNFFFFGNGERLYVELVPFALVAAALLLRHVGSVQPRTARALAIFLVGAGAVTSATHVAADGWERSRRPGTREVLARALADSGRTAPGILVFVRNPPLSEPLLIGLAPFNVGRFPGPVVVARDLGAENARLACRLPGYRVIMAEWAPAARDAHLVPATGDSLAASRCDRPPLVPTPRPPA